MAGIQQGHGGVVADKTGATGNHYTHRFNPRN
jgi:hypothetical protein